MRVSRRLLVVLVPIDGFRGRRCRYHRRPGRRFASRRPVRRHRRRLFLLLDFNLFILNLLDLNLLRLEVLVVRVPRSVVLVARVHVYRAASRGGYLGSRGKLLHRHDWRQRWRRRRAGLDRRCVSASGRRRVSPAPLPEALPNPLDRPSPRGDRPIRLLPPRALVAIAYGAPSRRRSQPQGGPFRLAVGRACDGRILRRLRAGSRHVHRASPPALLLTDQAQLGAAVRHGGQSVLPLRHRGRSRRTGALAALHRRR